MNNDNQNNSGIYVVIVIVAIIMVMIMTSIGKNSSTKKSQSSYEKSLYDAYDKIQDGEKLTPAEQRAWDDFKEWERKNY